MFTCCLLSCSGQQKASDQVVVKKERGFQLPEVPAVLNTPEARATYVCEHYWDHFDFADTTYIHLPEITGQAIVNFMDLMLRVPKDLAERSMVVLYQKVAPYSRMSWHFWETMARYWNSVNSPMRNEDMLISLCRSIESVPQVENTLKTR